MEQISSFLSSLRNKLSVNKKNSFTLALIMIFIFLIQFWYQWEVVTREYCLPSRDTYGWVGQLWHLLEKGYLWRERLAIHYPKGHTFFMVGPLLIFPDFRFAYFFFKFGGIPFFSLYLITTAVILKRIFKKNYMVLTGLILVLTSNILFSRFSVFSASIIPSLGILISLIVLRSKCPFYLIGFFIPLMFLCNAIFAFFYIIAIGFLILIKIYNKEKRLKTIIIDDILKTFFFIFILLLSFIVHTLIVLDTNLIEFLNRYMANFAPLEVKFSYDFNIVLLNYTFADVLDNLVPHNSFMYAFLDLEKRLFSFFILFDLIILIFPTKKYFKEQFKDIINFGKFTFLIIISLYLADVMFSDVQNVFFLNIVWFNWRAIEGFAGPLVILACFLIEKVVEKAKIFTIYLQDNYSAYKKLISNEFFSKFFKIEHLIISIIIISSLSALCAHKNIYISYHFEQEHIDTVFFIKENVPSDSKILVNFYDGMGDALHSLLSTYRLYDWEFSENRNNVTEIKEYIKEKNIKYVLLDLSTLNSTELYNFTSDYRFDKSFENEIHVLFEYED